MYFCLQLEPAASKDTAWYINTPYMCPTTVVSIYKYRLGRSRDKQDTVYPKSKRHNENQEKTREISPL